MPDELVAQFSRPDPNLFVVEGRWCVEALLDSNKFEIIAVLRSENSQKDFDSKYLHRTDIHVLPKEELSKVLGFHFHRGIIALAKRPPVSPLPMEKIRGVLVACPELADESNLGAIIRTAAALGAAGILVPHQHGADVFSRKAIRSSSGAVFRLPIYECADPAEDMSNLRKAGFTIIGTSPGKGSIPLRESPLFSDAIVILGPENGGLSEEWLHRCDLKIEIPMANGIDSLNVAACAAIVLYHLTSEIRT